MKPVSKQGSLSSWREARRNRSGESILLMESAGGQEIHVTDQTLPHPCHPPAIATVQKI